MSNVYYLCRRLLKSFLIKDILSWNNKSESQKEDTRDNLKNQENDVKERSRQSPILKVTNVTVCLLTKNKRNEVHMRCIGDKGVLIIVVTDATATAALCVGQSVLMLYHLHQKLPDVEVDCRYCSCHSLLLVCVSHSLV